MDAQPTPTIPGQFGIEDGTETQLEFVVDANTGAGSLLLTALDGSGAIEVPITQDDARQLVAALAEYCWPGCRLASAPAAGRA